MLDRNELLDWCRSLNISEEARTVLDVIRTSDPARRVQSGCRNVSGTYPSKKMKLTIQFESHRVELAAVYEMEHDNDVLEYYDQPPSFKLEYAGMNGRRMTVLHTPDYFAIRKNTAGWGMQDRGRTRKTLSEESSPLLSRRRWTVALPTWRRVCRAIQFLLSGPHVKDHKLGLPAQHTVHRGLFASGPSCGR